MPEEPDKLADEIEKIGVVAQHRSQITIQNLYLGRAADAPTKPAEDVPDSGEIPACPYQGLSAFQEEHAEFFFGRDRYIDLLIQKVQVKPLVAVVGSSGSGKSSLVLAGLVPRLRQAADWLITSFRPKNQPFDELAGALVNWLEPDLGKTDQVIQAVKLAKALQSGELSLQQVVSRIEEPRSPKLLLIADQFEELYTLSPESDRIPFIDVLLAGVRNVSGLKLVLTLRADFCEQAYKHEAFTDALQDADLKLSAMNREDLRLAIECPAKLKQVELEAGLAERILDDVRQEPGNLPLLEFALTQLWAKQQHRKLTHQAYNEIGGVTKALANHAEAVYTTLTQAEQKQAQQIFLQLVQLGEGAEDTRRIANHTKIDDDCWNLITRKDGLADQRLVVTGRNEQSKEETVEIIHEALIREWRRLSQWLNQNRDKLRQKQKIEIAADEWKDKEKSKDYLLQGKSLRDAKGFLQEQSSSFSLSDLAKLFIKESRQQRRKVLAVAGIILTVPLSIAAFMEVIAAKNARINQLWQIVEVYSSDENYGEKRKKAFEELVKAGESFANRNLRDLDLSGANLSNADFYRADLSGADLSGANLSGANFNCVTLSDSRLVPIRGRDNHGQSERETQSANFSGANLDNASFQGTDLDNIDFKGANLRNVDFSDLYIGSVGNDLTGYSYRNNLKSISGKALTAEQLRAGRNSDKAYYRDKEDCKKMGIKECKITREEQVTPFWKCHVSQNR